jgi:hypothetical protein
MHSAAMTIRDTLAENFKKLRAATPSLDKPKDIIKAGAATNGTIGRIAKKQTGISIDKLEQLANAYGLEVWQMLSPSMHAERGKTALPVVSGLPEWPFEVAPQDEYDALDQTSKIAVQVKLRDIIREEAKDAELRRRNVRSN